MTHGFRPNAEFAALVARICVRVDGLPLAIDLAAVRTATLPLTTLADRLDGRLDLLGGRDRTVARQRTLDDVVAWSYDLRTAAQQRLFRRLGVFAGITESAIQDAIAERARTAAVITIAHRLSTVLDADQIVPPG